MAKPLAPHMQHGFHQLTRELAMAMHSLVSAAANVRAAAEMISYSRRKR